MEFSLFKKKSKGVAEVSKDSLRSYHSVTDEEIYQYSKGLNSDLRVIHFTHTDIAGKVCSLLGQRSFSNIETKYCSNRDVDDIINTFILIDKKYSNYDLILISDVSLNKGTLINLENLQKFSNGLIKIRYFNHQECNLEYADKYSWVTIEPEYDAVKQDSASILYRHLINEFNLLGDEWLDNLVEKSRRYTKWEWQELNDEIPNFINMLCHDTGHSFFVKKLIKKHIAKADLLDEEDFDKLDYLESKYQEYKDRKVNEVILTRINSTKIGFVAAEQHIDRLGSDIPKHYKNLDSVIIMNSLVAANIRNTESSTVDASQIAKVFGGNGGKMSAGAAIPVDIREAVINYFINISQEKFKKIKK